MIELLMIRQNWLAAMYAGVAFMVIVPAAVSIYYHRRIRLLAGGRRLRNAQRQLAPQHGNVASNLVNAFTMWSRVQADEFGPEARRVVGRCNAILLLWIVIVAGWFGVLLYAEEQVKLRGGGPEEQAEQVNAGRERP